jgi:regulatory protein
MGDSSGKEITITEARAMAYRFLGHREHSRRELDEKLARRGVPPGVVMQTLDELEDEGLLSDRRFAESFIRSRISRMQGPFKIRGELKKRGINDELIQSALAEHEDSWRGLALEWASRRLRGELDQKEKARLYRGGTNRGFSHEHMMRALDALRAGETGSGY